MFCKRFYGFYINFFYYGPFACIKAFDINSWRYVSDFLTISRKLLLAMVFEWGRFLPQIGVFYYVMGKLKIF